MGQIKKLHGQGISPSEIGKLSGVGRTSVYRALSGCLTARRSTIRFDLDLLRLSVVLSNAITAVLLELLTPLLLHAAGPTTRTDGAA
jgi:hypothetical protein